MEVQVIFPHLSEVMRADDPPTKVSAEDKIRTILASIADCYVKVDTNWRFVEINSAAELKIYRRPAAELLGRNVWEAYPHCVGNEFYELYHRAVRERRPLHAEGRTGIRDAWFEVYAHPCEDGLEVYSREITERKAAERQLAEAKRQAEEANAAKDRFLASLSHELRTPLTPIMLGVQLLLRRNDLPREVIDALLTIARNAETEARLIDDLLDLTRIVQCKVRLKLEELDLHEVVKAAVEVCRLQIEERSLQLELRLAAANTRIIADKTRLQQVVWNLLSNAAKFSPLGGQIVISSSDQPNRLELSFCDHGVGIPAEMFAKLFSPFEQADIGQFGGLGLGLAISKGLIEAHGGSITAVSPGAGQGATFTVTLPVGE